VTAGYIGQQAFVANDEMATAPATIEDSDVLAEKAHVKTLNVASTAVVVNDINKWYGDFNAVKGVSFHVEIGDCFGLLGEFY
jgi:ABC-type glutathione transport system ATPase component